MALARLSRPRSGRQWAAAPASPAQGDSRRRGAFGDARRFALAVADGSRQGGQGARRSSAGNLAGAGPLRRLAAARRGRDDMTDAGGDDRLAEVRQTIANEEGIAEFAELLTGGNA